VLLLSMKFPLIAVFGMGSNVLDPSRQSLLSSDEMRMAW
jgi:hypothetical protein